MTGETYSDPNPEEMNLTLTKSFAIKHDLSEVLHKSLLFYESQRSGKLPAENRISWRYDAFVNDTGENGEDLRRENFCFK